MRINIFSIVLVVLYFIASLFFGLLKLPLPIYDAMLIICIVIFVFYMKEFNTKFINEDRHFHYFFIYGFLASIVMAYLNFGQPVIYSMRAMRIFLIYSIILMVLNILLKKFQIKQAHSFMVFVTFLIVFINVYVYITGDISMLVEGQGVLKRLGEIRVTIGTFTSVIFVLYFYHALKENKWFFIPLIALLFTMIVVAKTRSVIFPILIIMLIPLLRAHKAQVFKIWLAFGFLVLVSFMVSGYEKSFLSPIIDLVLLLIEESQTDGHSNVNIRGLELLYFWDFLDVKSMIFGFGKDNLQFIELYEPHYWLSDIGLFKIFYLHGIVGVFLFAVLHWRLYKVSKYANTPLHLTGRGIVYFQILSPSSVFTYEPEYMFLIFFVYILIKKYNQNINNNLVKKDKN